MNKQEAAEKILLAGGAASLGFVFASVWSVALQYIFLALAAIAAAALFVAVGSRPWRDAAPRWSLRSAVVFALVAAVSAFLPDDRRAGLDALPALLLPLATPLAFLPFAGSKPLARHCMNWLAAGTLLGIVIALCRIPKDGLDGARLAPFLGVMNYGGALGALYPLALALFLDSLATRRRGRPLFFFAVSAMLALGAFLNGTRIIWISLAATTLFLLLACRKRISRRGWLGVLALGLVPALAVCSSPSRMERVLVTSRFAFERFESLSLAEQSIPPADNAPQDDSSEIRIALFSDAVKRIPDLPLFGHGPGSASALIFAAREDILGHRDDLVISHFHNTFLNTLVETGWPGLAALLCLFAPSARLAGRNFLSPSGRRRLWSRILFAVLLAFAVHSMTDTLFRIRSAMQVYGFLLALCWAHLPDDGGEGKQ